MAKTETVRAQDSVEAKIVRAEEPSPTKMACPNCGAIRYRQGAHYEVLSNGSERVVNTEWQCVGCNRTYQRDELVATSRT